MSVNKEVFRDGGSLEIEECDSDDPLIKCKEYDGEHDCVLDATLLKSYTT